MFYLVYDNTASFIWTWHLGTYCCTNWWNMSTTSNLSKRLRTSCKNRLMQFFRGKRWRVKEGEGKGGRKEKGGGRMFWDETLEIKTPPFLLSSLCPHTKQCNSFSFSVFLYSRRRVRCFYFFLLWKKKSFHFWSGREHKGPSPSLALVSIVFVLLISVQDLFFDFLTLTTFFFFFLESKFWEKKRKIVELIMFLFFCFWMHKSINTTATK